MINNLPYRAGGRRLRLIPIRNFLIALLCAVSVCSLIYHCGIAFNEFRPCDSSPEDKVPMKGTLATLKSVLMGSEVPVPCIHDLIQRAFDADMDKLISFELNGPSYELLDIETPGEPELVKYFRMRIKQCEQQVPEPCRSEIMLLIMQQLDIHSKGYTEAPVYIMTVTPELVKTKKDEIYSLLNKIYFLRPLKGCSMGQIVLWDNLISGLEATITRLEGLLSVFKAIQFEADKDFRKPGPGSDAWRTERYLK